MKSYCVEVKQYIVSKNADNILLLHGWGVDSGIFHKYVEILRDKYNLYLVDFYGFGQSVDPKPFFDVYEYAMQVYLFLKENNIQKIHIIAHSFGGRVAILLSTIFDISIDKMILTGCAGLKPKRSLIYYYRIYKYKLLKRVGLIKGGRGSIDYNLCKDKLRPVFVRVVNQHLNFLVEDVRNKTLLVWGVRDQETPMYMCRHLKNNIPNVRCCLINDGEHFVLFTHIYLIKNKIVEYLKYG